MGSLDEILDRCQVVRGPLPTKGDVGRITGGGNYALNGDHIDHSYEGKLRPFCEGDWMAYSGCEDSHPLIGELRGRMVEETKWEAEVVVDGNTLCVFFYPDIDDERTIWFCVELESLEATIAIASAILGMKDVRGQWGLVRRLMVSMGDQLPREMVVR